MRVLHCLNIINFSMLELYIEKLNRLREGEDTMTTIRKNIILPVTEYETINRN